MKNTKRLVFAVFVLVGLINSLDVFAQTGSAYWDAYNFGYNLFYDALRDANRIKYTIVNSTGYSIQEIYISSSNSDRWGNNQWTSQELFLTNRQIEAKSDDVGPYDIMLVDTNGDSYVKQRIRITSDLVVTFKPEDKVKGLLESLGNAWDSLWN